MGRNYKIVRSSRGIRLKIGRGEYLSVGSQGKNVMIRGAGKAVVFSSWEQLVSAIDVNRASCHRSHEPVHKRVGECVIDGKGRLLVLRRRYYGQGWIFKDWDAFYHELREPCYVSELSETVYTREDFLNLCKGQEDIAAMIFEAVNWQNPDVYLEEQYQEGELAICSFCGNIYMGYEVDRCPYCGSEREKEWNT